VAHSLGGIVVKKVHIMMLVPLTHLITVLQAMILASSTESAWNSIFQNTAGIVFLGTPYRGPSAIGRGWRILPSRRHILWFLSPPPLLSFLRANSTACSDSKPVQRCLGVTQHILLLRDKGDAPW
jgi:hypothetical protein